MTSTLYLMACLMTVVVSKPYLPWMYPSMYTTNPGMTSPLMTGMFISKAVGPNAKMMFDAYNKVWGYEGDEAGEGNANKLLFWFIYIGSLSWRQWSQFWGDRRWGRADSEVWRVEPGHEVQHGDHLDWVDRRGGDEDVHLEDQPQQHQNQEHGGG